MTTEVDLLVAGAGPAGCAAALAARRTAPGLRVLVVDAARFPRDKLCGGAITGGGLREMAQAGLELRVPRVSVSHVVLRVEGREHRVRLQRPAAVIRRIEWDADLVAQVRAAGVEVAEGAGLAGLRRAGEGGRGPGGPGAGRWMAETAAGPVRFRLLVAADGSAGASLRLLGLGPGRRAPAREGVCPGGAPVELLFDLDAGIPGYAWRFPCLLGGAPAHNAGIYSLEPSPRLSTRLVAWMEREGAGRLEPAAWSIRTREPGGPVAAGPALLAGEALGVDPLAGEGIRYALWSGRIAGRLAARVLVAGAVGLAPALYRAALATSRSGVTLALFSRLAPRLHGPDPRWRRMASDRAVAEGFAALVSGASAVGPGLRLLARHRALSGGRP